MKHARLRIARRKTLQTFAPITSKNMASGLYVYKSLTEPPVFVYRMDDAMSLRDVLGVNFEEDEEVFDPFASDGLSLPGAGGPGLLGAFDRKARASGK